MPLTKQHGRGVWSETKDRDLLDLIGMSSAIRGAMTQEQLVAYQIVFRIEEISHKLRHEDQMLEVPPSGDPAPAPPPAPVYDATGKRVNTPEYLYRKRLEEERHALVESAIRAVPGFVPPSDYRPEKLTEKVFIPVREHPEINFIGLLIGPRGNTLRKLEQDSGARIAIRGKGSVKEGKNRSTATTHLEEDLHCLVTGDDAERLRKGVDACKAIINKAVYTPEGQNDLKRGQLRELAAINGTLREYEDRPCASCGELGHKRYDCPKRQSYLESVVCRVCGGAGHFARDCKFRSGSSTVLSNADREYQQMMQELNFDVGRNAAGALPNAEQDTQPPYKKRNLGAEFSHRPYDDPRRFNSTDASHDGYTNMQQTTSRRPGYQNVYNNSRTDYQRAVAPPPGMVLAAPPGMVAGPPVPSDIPSSIPSVFPPPPPPPPPGLLPETMGPVEPEPELAPPPPPAGPPDSSEAELAPPSGPPSPPPPPPPA